MCLSYRSEWGILLSTHTTHIVAPKTPCLHTLLAGITLAMPGLQKFSGEILETDGPGPAKRHLKHPFLDLNFSQTNG